MSWSGDLGGVVRGLAKVAQALASHQQREAQRLWANSSMRVVTQQAGDKIDRVVTNQQTVKVGYCAQGQCLASQWRSGSY